MLLNRARAIVGEARSRYFDWRHNVRTSGDALLGSLTITGDSARHGVHYHPSHPKFLRGLFADLRIEHQRFTFIDLGSGKGRVLLVASEFPFRRIIGVEFARELHDIASDNARRYRSTTQRQKHIECLHQDAMIFQFPADPIVLYLFNPFGPGVLTPVLRNLDASIASSPREVWLLYLSAFHGELVEQETRLSLVRQTPYHNEYHYRPVAT